MKKKPSIYAYPYFAALRSPMSMELLKASKNAFVLLYVIAWRARRTNEFNSHNLTIGEAFLGDFKDCGLTESEYKTAKKYLAKNQFASFRPTSKGTIATLINNGVFDINIEDDDEQSDEQPTARQRPDNVQVDGQMTTNKNEKNENKENNAQEPVGKGVSVGFEKKPPAVVNDENKKSSAESLAEHASSTTVKSDHSWMFSPEDILYPVQMADKLAQKPGLVAGIKDDLRKKLSEDELATLVKYRGAKSETQQLRQVLVAGLNRIVNEGTNRCYENNKHHYPNCPQPSNQESAEGWMKINRALLEIHFKQYLRPLGDKMVKPKIFTAEMIYENYPKQVNNVAAISVIREKVKTTEPAYLRMRTLAFKTMIGEAVRYVPSPEKWYSQENYHDPKSWEQWKERKTSSLSQNYTTRD